MEMAIALILDAMLRLERAGKDDVTASRLAAAMEAGYKIPKPLCAMVGMMLETQGLLTVCQHSGHVTLSDEGRKAALESASVLDAMERDNLPELN